MSFVSRWESGTSELVAVTLHGTGGDEHSLVSFTETLLPFASILSLRGRLLERGAPRFFRRFAEGVFDYNNIREEADALAQTVSDELERRGKQGAPVVFVGYSNGANMALATLLTHPRIAKGGILFRPMITLTPAGGDPTTSLVSKPDLSGVKLFLSSGKSDLMVDLENVIGLQDQLKHAHAEVTLNLHEGGHELNRTEVETARVWASENL